jgi:predicted HAD superfamily hydrolase
VFKLPVPSIDDKPEAVFFCARDGYIVQRVYDALAATCKAPPLKYLMVSRRALVVPTFTSLGPGEIGYLTGNRIPISVRQCLERIGLRPEDCTETIRAAGLLPETVIWAAHERSQMRGLLSALEPQILVYFAKERDLLVKYLRQMGCCEAQQIDMCDLGWNASLQMALVRILSDLNPGLFIRGFYFATFSRAQDKLAGLKTQARGMLANAGKPAGVCGLLDDGKDVIELMFTAPHGSVLGYEEVDGQARAVLDSLAAGAEPYVAAATAIQAAGMSFVEHFIRAYGGTRPDDVSREQMLVRVSRLLRSPTYQEAKLIGSLWAIDGIGATRTGQALAKMPALRTVVRNPMNYLRAYRTSYWRRGFEKIAQVELAPFTPLHILFRLAVRGRAAIRAAPDHAGLSEAAGTPPEPMFTRDSIPVRACLRIAVPKARDRAVRRQRRRSPDRRRPNGTQRRRDDLFFFGKNSIRGEPALDRGCERNRESD